MYNFSFCALFCGENLLHRIVAHVYLVYKQVLNKPTFWWPQK